MKRYQMYLEPMHVNVIDKIAEWAAVPRSQIVRDMMAFIVSRYSKLAIRKEKNSKAHIHPFDKYIGKFKLGDPYASQNIDEIYDRI